MGALTDQEYRGLWTSLQGQENHVCTRQCEFKQVFGNMFYCVTSGQAHVCDQNCNQRIFYDNHTDICRLSRRLFPRTEAAMADGPRKRGGEEAAAAQAKRPLSADWQQQQVLTEQQAAAAAATAQQAQQQAQPFVLGGAHWGQAPPQTGWAF
ncbi:hypothetical protein ABPG75_012032 [Micractinium tetrahymenae]